MPLSFEGAREWETLKYQHSFPVPTSVTDDPTTPVARDAIASSADTALTAFAQLASLRLNTTRALISLFDRDHQFVVAEATQSIPLSPSTQYAQGANFLWLCGSIVPRSYGICEHVLVGATGGPDPSDSFVRPPHRDLHVSVIPDLSEDPRFADRPYIRDAPHYRFYVGVPIRSPKGFNIGVLSLFDVTPRPDGLDSAALQLVVDISQTIMTYLDSRRVNDSYLRSERMVLGLGNFLQGKDEPTTWWSKNKNLHPAHSNTRPNSRHPSASATHTVSVTEDGVQVHQVDHDRPPSEGPPLRPTTAIRLAKDGPPPTSHKSESNELANAVPSVAAVSSIGRSPTPPIDLHQAQVENILTTAADIIRVCLDVEGTIFLDASVGSFGRLVDSAHLMNRADSVDDITSSSEDSSSSQTHSRQDEQNCKVFAVSRWDKSATRDGKPDKDSVMMTDRFLAKLLRRYPNGRIFSFDAAGAWYSGESSSGDDATEPEKDKNAESRPPKVRRSPDSRRNEARIIGSLFPGARSVALFPLWDPSRDKWYAGGFIWSKTPARILTTDADLPYLRAFGMITMAEINKLDALLADKAKTDILGSLSHELRSPLHGVVAAAELLRDTQLDVFQMDVVHTIEISGKTLLDTIDHLLAYSKVNSFLSSSRTQRRNVKTVRGLSKEADASIESGMVTLTSDVALDVLAEEVIESVFIGHSFQHMAATHLARHAAEGPITSPRERLDAIYSTDPGSTENPVPEELPTSLGDVQVIIDIDPTRHWWFHTQPGAIRRIIMNLFGNALKYTTRGHVKISLRQEDMPQKAANNTGTMLVLTVTDSGKGIGEDFLRNKLFAPFSQEDHLAPGTGLGLSLVRQIVASLGGSISVKSHVGRGTSVVVSIPLPFAQRQQDSRDHGSPNGSPDRGLTQPLRASAIGFSDASVNCRVSGESSVSPLKSLPLQWCNITLCELISLEDGPVAADADLAIYSEAAYRQLDKTTLDRHPVPAVVVCHNVVNAMRLDPSPWSAKHSAFEFVHQPITPRKFGKAVMAALTRWRELQATRTSAKPTSFSAPVDSGAVSTIEDGLSAIRIVPDPGTAPFQGMIPGPHVWRTMPEGVRRLGSIDDDSDFTSVTSPGVSSDLTPPTDVDIQDDKNTLSVVAQAMTTSGKNKCDDDSRNRDEQADRCLESDNEPEKKTNDDRSHFLIVDDNPINLKLLSTFMTRLGREHCTATNGLEALETFTGSPGKFCCILMDINMPVMDGLESTRKIRHLERSRQLPPVTVIAITGLGSQSDREEAFASGLDLFLTRPVKMGDLFAILKERGLGGQDTDGDSVATSTATAKTETITNIAATST
ncbi:hypothetical protein ACRALDRAFT_1075415 [Sodiomyces alcalophilus JCM 7366]|uniref:uncharacterized protein n=1 Tax=Sodiomyces alcalophilus JCM 7366 TaxID=591952 RepID=UPI0039B6D061